MKGPVAEPEITKKAEKEQLEETAENPKGKAESIHNVKCCWGEAESRRCRKPTEWTIVQILTAAAPQWPETSW